LTTSKEKWLFIAWGDYFWLLSISFTSVWSSLDVASYLRKGSLGLNALLTRNCCKFFCFFAVATPTLL